MKKQVLPLLLSVVCLLFMVFFGVASLVEEDRRNSDTENRYLQLLPEFTVDAAMSGAYFTTLDRYFSDQIYARDSLFRSYALAHYKSGLHRVGEVIIGKDEDLVNYYEYSYRSELVTRNAQRKIDRNIAVIEKIDAIMREHGGDFVFVQMPAKRVMHADAYPKYYENNADTAAADFDIITEELKKRGIRTIDLRDALSKSELECYYQTDHHISPVGAMAVYNRLMQSLETYDDRIRRFDFTWEEIDIPMLGSYNRQIAGIIENADRIGIPTPVGLEESFSYIRTDYYEDRENHPLIVVEPKNGTLRYNAYMGGDLGLTIMDTKRRDYPSMIFSGDSYTNILEPLLFYSFDKSYYLDTRYVQGNFDLEEYIRRREPEVYIMMHTAPVPNLFITDDLMADPL